jgi:hypothetical protein
VTHSGFPQELLSLGAHRAAVVPNVYFRQRVRDTKVKQGRELLVISLKDLTTQERQRLLDTYNRGLANTISFPLKQKATHLKVRYGGSLFSFFCYSLLSFLPRFREQKFEIPNKTSLEVVLNISETESQSLLQYIGNISQNPRRLLGWFSMKGTQHTRGKINDNRPLKGCHNCTSWIATAPIGDNSQPLLEILGGDQNLLVGTNPGWWTNWLAATAPAERLPFIIFWSEKSIEQTLREDVHTGKNLDWDFNKR